MFHLFVVPDAYEPVREIMGYYAASSESLSMLEVGSGIDYATIDYAVIVTETDDGLKEVARYERAVGHWELTEADYAIRNPQD